jgi:hypothetical protein
VLYVAGKDFEEGRFACAVRADDTVAVAGSEFEVHVLEEGALAESEGEVGDRDQLRRLLVGILWPGCREGMAPFPEIRIIF